MIHSLNMPAKLRQVNYPAGLLYLAYGIILLVCLGNYINWQSVNIILGLMALPLVVRIQRGNCVPVRFAVASVLLAGLSLVLPVKTILYGAVLLAVFFVIESFRGKVNALPLLVIALMSPFAQYAANIISFPVRLQLTAWAGKLLNATGTGTTVKGNMIFCNGNEYSVDPACMGLNMLVVSLLLQLVLTGIYQRRYRRQAKVWQVLALLAVVFILNIVSNLCRIFCLVLFDISPEAIGHSLTGIGCLLLYVIAPAVLLTRWMIARYGQPVMDDYRIRSLPGSKLLFLHSLLLVTILFSAAGVVKNGERMNSTAGPVPGIAGYQVHKVRTDIIKLRNDQSLVYIKHIPSFYNADHNPMICWRGSGYELRRVNKEILDGVAVYTALLQHDEDRLYTCWWYDNGMNRTIDQFAWRWDVLKGAGTYSVVNVTAASESLMQHEAKAILNDNRLKPLL